MRGAEALYLPFFIKEQPDTEQGKGRSGYLIERRDNKLMLRYYFHTWHKKLSYDDTIRQLSLEFDLAERTIQDRLLMNSETVSQLMRQKPPVVSMRKEFPFYNWS
jgi:hypothetical protein